MLVNSQNPMPPLEGNVLVDALMKSPLPSLIKQSIVDAIVQVWKMQESIKFAIAMVQQLMMQQQIQRQSWLESTVELSTSDRNLKHNEQMILQTQQLQLENSIAEFKEKLSAEQKRYENLTERYNAFLTLDPTQTYLTDLQAQNEKVIAGGVDNLFTSHEQLFVAKNITREELQSSISAAVILPKESIIKIEDRVNRSTEEYNRDIEAFNHAEPDKTKHRAPIPAPSSLPPQTRALRPNLLIELQMLIALRAILTNTFPELSSAQRKLMAQTFISGLDMRSRIAATTQVIVLADSVLCELKLIQNELQKAKLNIDNVAEKLEQLTSQANRVYSTTPTLVPSSGSAQEDNEEEEQQQSNYKTPTPSPFRNV